MSHTYDSTPFKFYKSVLILVFWWNRFKSIVIFFENDVTAFPMRLWSKLFTTFLGDRPISVMSCLIAGNVSCFNDLSFYITL